MRYVDLLARLDGTRAAGVVLGLDRTRFVLARLGDPQRHGVSVQIAGTNGKGSTAAMTEAILRAAGIRTGLYTSPHLNRFTERIRIDGAEIDGDRLARLADAMLAGDPAIDAGLTYFELATVLAFMAFAEAGVEAVVLETGLGGRLDATTVCEPVATAITSIAMDHAELLGPTLGHIAREKAGIAKPGVPLMLPLLTPEADSAIVTEATRIGAPVWRLGRDFALPPVRPALGGAHQLSNAALAIALARAIAHKRGRTLDSRAVETGLCDVVWPGRMETILNDVLLDCAHNAEGALALVEALDRLPVRRRALVFSVVAGKPAATMLSILAPRFESIFLTRSSNQRSLTPAELTALLPHATGDGVRMVANPRDALEAARAAVAPDGLVVAAGSTFLVGDLRADLLGEARDPLPTSDPVSPHFP